VERLTRQEHTAQPLPPTIKDLLLQITPPPPIHQRITLHCGGKRKTRLTVDPEFREMDTTPYESQTHPPPSPRHSPPSTHTEPTDPPLSPRPGMREPWTSSRQAPHPSEYIMNSAHLKTPSSGVPGHWRLRTQHTRARKKIRHLTGKQLQWQVQWGPTVMEAWEMNLNITHLKYKPTLQRLATPEDLQQHQKLICEHCHGTSQLHTCHQCHRGYHLACQPQHPEVGLCSQCQNSQSWPPNSN
jgi:hypothetical protein